MAEYADHNLGEEQDYGTKECPQCEGTGILFKCECDYCEGTGYVDRDIEDEIEDEWDYKTRDV